MRTATAGAGLTTTRSPFIEQAQAHGELYIQQPYELYTAENHEAWRRLYARMEDRWQRYANERFLEGIGSLCLDPQRVPRLDDVNRFLHPLTGFKAKAVSGYVPSFHFFDCLRNREFPTTITIRDAASLDYLPEPDIFHDIAGHVPMHTDRAFADLWCASATAPIPRRRSQRDQTKGKIRGWSIMQAWSVLLVHHRVRPHAESDRPQGVWQRLAQFVW
jgi:phenylalanine-4-hydroxylase